ncbi:PAS domain S-box protein [Deinococcus psychrotolerans]|uniref:histidine kinase n=1 Tax=Deinococcus psychrotolerans TaxID=2489213 RepID=A0A3G8YIT6_9DEIO|nr:PAS domain-containing protein [Deinococcus psychrotolerans]AZI44187.1 PAS domain S-box protein [Deinococcus psychrotolerans]
MNKRHIQNKNKESSVSIAALVRALPQAAMVTDGQGRASHVNAHWAQSTGLNISQSFGLGWLEAVHPNDREAASAMWGRTAPNRQPVEAEYRTRWNGDTDCVCVWYHAPLLEGSTRLWLCTVAQRPALLLREMQREPELGSTLLETTNLEQPTAMELERERILEQLALEQADLRTVLDQLPLGLLVVSADTRRIRLVNPQTEQIFGVSLTVGMTLGRIEALRYSRDEITAPADFSLHRALAGVRVEGEETEIGRPDGSRATIRSNAVPIYDRQGELVAAVLSTEDLSAQRRAEAEEERLSGSLQRAREALTLHGGRPVTPERFLKLMGELYEQLGQPQLEGRLIALLLLRAEPVSVGEVASMLSVSKVAISKVSNAMLERGDLQIIKSFSSREHLLTLTDHNYIRDLSVRRVASWAISILCDSLLETNHLDPAITEQIRNHLETHTRVAVALEQVLSPIERRQAKALADHLRENWDAVSPKSEKS